MVRFGSENLLGLVWYFGGRWWEGNKQTLDNLSPSQSVKSLGVGRMLRELNTITALFSI